MLDARRRCVYIHVRLFVFYAILDILIYFCIVLFVFGVTPVWRQA